MGVISAFAPAIASAVRAWCVEFLTQAARAGPDRRHGLGRLDSRIKLPAGSPPGSMNARHRRRESGRVSVARNNTAAGNSRAAPR
jgi:hypothetical protein